jgi:putative flippase GtrA
MTGKKEYKRNFIITGTFIRAQISSLFSTGIDWSITFLLTDFMNLWYVVSAITGACSGGITNFFINRHWVFKANIYNKTKQFYRYILVWICSIVLNITGTVFFVEIAGFHYMVAKVATAILVAIGFNFLMQKKFVFKFST